MKIIIEVSNASKLVTIVSAFRAIARQGCRSGERDWTRPASLSSRSTGCLFVVVKLNYNWLFLINVYLCFWFRAVKKEREYSDSSLIFYKILCQDVELFGAESKKDMQMPTSDAENEYNQLKPIEKPT